MSELINLFIKKPQGNILPQTENLKAPDTKKTRQIKFINLFFLSLYSKYIFLTKFISHESFSKKISFSHGT